MPTSPLSVLKRQILNSKVPQFQRINFLKLLGESASLSLLKTVADDKTAPGRLVGLAAAMYIQKVAERQIARQNGEHNVLSLNSLDGTD